MRCKGTDGPTVQTSTNCGGFTYAGRINATADRAIAPPFLRVGDRHDGFSRFRRFPRLVVTSSPTRPHGDGTINPSALSRLLTTPENVLGIASLRRPSSPRRGNAAFPGDF